MLGSGCSVHALTDVYAAFINLIQTSLEGNVFFSSLSLFIFDEYSVEHNQKQESELRGRAVCSVSPVSGFDVTGLKI